MDKLKLEIDSEKIVYNIHIGKGLFPELSSYLSRGEFSNQVIVITDKNVFNLYGEKLRENFDQKDYETDFFILPPGEKEKNLDRLRWVYDQALTKNKLDRRSPLVAFGGGVVGDLAGFAAATIFRGLPFIQVPTTLLALVDSSVGGKVAVNHSTGKNLIGAFYQPRAVFADLEMLKTLPIRELTAGMAEVIKHGMICDSDFFTFLEQHVEEIKELNLDFLQEVVKECCRIKAEVVKRDEKESGLRMILNYGHTLGHALESMTNHSPDIESLKHGEAVAMGMSAASEIAVRMGVLDKEKKIRQDNLLKRAGLDIEYPEVEPDKILEFLFRDKKRISNQINFILPLDIGRVEISKNVDEKFLLRVLKNNS